MTRPVSLLSPPTARSVLITALLVLLSTTGRTNADDSSPFTSVESLLALVRTRELDVGGNIISQDTGTAWAIGRIGGRVVFVTAAHTVVHQGKPVDVQLRLANCLQPIDAKVELDSFSQSLDLAVLEARPPDECQDSYASNPLPGLALDLMRDAVIDQVGQRLVVHGFGTEDRLQSRHPAQLTNWESSAISFSPPVLYGMSGGMVTTEDGDIVGVVVREGQALRIDEMLRHLKQKQVSTNLVGAFGVLHVRGLPDGTQLELDNLPYESIRRTRYVAPGPHTVRVLAPGYQVTQKKTISIDPGEAELLCASLAEPINHAWRAARFPVLIGGAALLAGAVITGILGKQSRSDFYRDPSRSGLERTETLNVVTDALLIGSGASAATFIAGSLLWNATEHSTLSQCE